MSNATQVNPKALIGGVINSDNELFTLEDMQEFLKQCAELIGPKFEQHKTVRGVSFSYYLKDGRQQFNEEEATKLDHMIFQCGILCADINDDMHQLIDDAIHEARGLMREHDVQSAIMGIVGETIDLDQVVSIEENAGSNYITLANGEAYFIMVVPCEEEAE